MSKVFNGLASLCEHCDEPTTSVVTDPWGGNASFVCDNCQEAAYDRQQEWLMETGGGPSLIEQQRDAYRIKHGLPR
jgi:hypothetical protein